MDRLWRAWHEDPGRRTLVFCCSIEHARFAASWLTEQGVRAAAVFAATGSDDRSESVLALARGELDAVCAVDLFNEGVDIPEVDRVVILRPTDSPVVFLQQLGRGLRRHEGKRQLGLRSRREEGRHQASQRSEITTCCQSTASSIWQS